MWRLPLTCVLLLSAGCAHLPRAGLQDASISPSAIQLAEYSEEPKKHTVYVTGNGLHTGFVLKNEDIPREIWPEVDQIPDHPWVEVGWGSEIFYRAKTISLPVVVGAVFPNAAVLHVVGWDESPEKLLTGGDLIRLELDDAPFARLCRHIHRSYVHDTQGHVQDLGPGIYGDSRFLRATGKYYFPNTCNVWTAKGLKAAGLPIVPEMCGAPDPVIISARARGKTIRRR